VCGIAGGVAIRAGGRPDPGVVERLCELQRHRGPDDAGLFVSGDGSVVLGHRRLAIVDLSPAGRQPMSDPEGRVVVTCNGEIYNAPALREGLEKAGFRFRSRSDIEVLVHGHRIHGHALPGRLSGMFAYALYDRDTGVLSLVRDPLGIKPLYTAERGSVLYFASEVQALRRVLGGGGIDLEALAGYLAWGSVAPPRTLYRGIRALEAGASVQIGPKGERRAGRHHHLTELAGRSEPMEEREAGELIARALRASVRRHLLADVEVGAFLSGGVDSTALAALLVEEGSGPVTTVNLAFDAPELDEGALAEEAARHGGTRHRRVEIRLEQVREELPHALAALDQPSVDGINVYFVSRAAVQAGLKVAVSGIGGDELFGGYASHRRIPPLLAVHRRVERLDPGRRLRRRLGRWLEGMPGRTAAKLALAVGHGYDPAGAFYTDRGLFPPGGIAALLAPGLRDVARDLDPVAELRRALPLDEVPPAEWITLLELHRYLGCQLLRDADAMSMRHSLEVRVPLVDRALFEEVFRVPPELRRAGPVKRWLREAPRNPVPERLWRRPKQGFTLPFDRWLRSGRIEGGLAEHPFFHPPAVRALEAAFRAGRVHWSRVWALRALEPFLE